MPDDSMGVLNGKPRVYALMPAYNEAYSIAPVILEAQRHVDKVIVCDDGSLDATSKVAARMGATVLVHKKNRGRGAALKSCLKLALRDQPDIVVTLSAEGQHDPGLIPSLVEPMVKDEADVTYSESGFWAFSSKAFELVKNVKGAGFDGEADRIVKDLSDQVRVKEVPYQARYEKKDGPSKKVYPTRDTGIVDAVTRQIVERRPLLFLGVPGVLLFIVGTYALGLLLSYYLQLSSFSVPMSIVALGSYMMAIIFAIGFLLVTSLNKYKQP